jgi:acylphosphatase
MTEDNARVQLRVTGRVQGVYYRSSAESEARRLGLTGWVRNLPDGVVEALAEGPRGQLEAFVAWCRQGPPSAQVDAVDATWLPASGEHDAFEVRRSGSW